MGLALLHTTSRAITLSHERTVGDWVAHTLSRKPSFKNMCCAPWLSSDGNYNYNILMRFVFYKWENITARPQARQRCTFQMRITSLRHVLRKNSWSHSLFAAVAPLAASEFKKTLENPYMWFKQGCSNGRIALTHHWNRMWTSTLPIRRSRTSTSPVTSPRVKWTFCCTG